jgi:hypothetical protein
MANGKAASQAISAATRRPEISTDAVLYWS